jgi:hypothetical protein
MSLWNIFLLALHESTNARMHEPLTSAVCASCITFSHSLSTNALLFRVLCVCVGITNHDLFAPTLSRAQQQGAMSVRRSSRSIKPVENFGDVTFVGSYTKKYEAMKIAAAEKKAAEIKAKEALKLASKTRVKSTVTKATATKTGPKKNKKKIKRKKEEWVDDFESLASDDDDMDINVDCAYNPVPQKVKISRRKPPK